MSATSPGASRVIFVNRFYWPEEPATAQLLTDLAEKLATLGHEVIVIARHPGKAGVPHREIRNGVSIIRTSSTRHAGTSMGGKVLGFATFFVSALVRLLGVARPGDALVALTDPPLIGIGVWLVARLRGTRLFHWVQDIYPELAIELAGQRWLKIVRPLRQLAWRRAESNVTLGHDMAAVLLSSGVPPGKVSVIPNWAPAGLAPLMTETTTQLRTEWQLTGKFVVSYSGNFGRVHDLLPVLDIAEALRERAEICFVFIGDGAQRETLVKETQRRGLKHVLFKPAQPRASLGAVLALGDVHLVTLREGCERYVFPSKLYGIASVARPVIFIGPRECELAQLVEVSGFGFAFSPSETERIASSILALHSDPERRIRLGQAAVAFTLAAGGLEAAADQWHSFLLRPHGLAAPTVRS